MVLMVCGLQEIRWVCGSLQPLQVERNPLQMGLMSFFKRRSEPAPKVYPVSSPAVTDLVADVCSALKAQYQLLCGGEDRGNPPLVHWTNDGKPIIDLWLMGYISGFYDAASQSRGCPFELNALELIFCVFYGEEDARAAVAQYHVVRMALKSDSEAAKLFGFDEFEEGMLSGGNELFEWLSKKIQCPLKVYKRYSGMA